MTNPAPDSNLAHAARLQSWITDSAKLVDQLEGLLSAPETVEHLDGPYKVLYAQAQDALKQLESQLRVPEDASVADALRVFWSSPGPFMSSDRARMRRALQAAFNVVVASLQTVRLKRGLREFTSSEVEAGIAAAQAYLSRGVTSEADAELLVRDVLKAVSKAGRRT